MNEDRHIFSRHHWQCPPGAGDMVPLSAAPNLIVGWNPVLAAFAGRTGIVTTSGLHGPPLLPMRRKLKSQEFRRSP